MMTDILIVVNVKKAVTSAEYSSFATSGCVSRMFGSASLCSSMSKESILCTRKERIIAMTPYIVGKNQKLLLSFNHIFSCIMLNLHLDNLLNGKYPSFQLFTRRLNT